MYADVIENKSRKYQKLASGLFLRLGEMVSRS